MAINPTPRQLSLLKSLIFLLALIPFARMVWLTYSGQLVEPLEFITRGTGDWTLYFLCISLAVTPLRRFTQWNWLIKLRRMLGLFAFFYAALHFTTFLWFDHFFDVQEIAGLLATTEAVFCQNVGVFTGKTAWSNDQTTVSVVVVPI